MVEVIKHGYRKFDVTCTVCGCKFRYDIMDLDEELTVKCPECNHKHIHGSSVRETPSPTLTEVTERSLRNQYATGDNQYENCETYK